MADWEPPLERVADHLRHYTRDASGVEIGTFTAATTITAVEVVAATQSIVRDVEARVGAVPEVLWATAGDVASLGVAAEVIVDRDADLSRLLWERYTARLDRLNVAVRDAGDGTLDGSVGMPASGSFPASFAVDRTAF